MRLRAILFLLPLAVALARADAGTLSTVMFSTYTPLSSNHELASRFLTPMTAASVPTRLAAMRKRLSEQPVDLSKETFLLYVPAPQPSGLYGLLVFVPPWDEARLPAGWQDVLDRFGLIFVSASHSGNGETDLGRREPLAILAEQNIAKRYPVAPDRIFVAGFSGGSRVAMRLALAYPDLFGGAILNAGSDPIGTAEVPIPAPDLLRLFQEHSRLIYVTGARDITRLAMDAASIRSMRSWCQFNIQEIRPDSDHTVTDSRALARAFDALLAPAEGEPIKLVACREAIRAELSSQIGQLHALDVAGKTDEARTLAREIDARFGGLAAREMLSRIP